MRKHLLLLLLLVQVMAFASTRSDEEICNIAHNVLSESSNVYGVRNGEIPVVLKRTDNLTFAGYMDGGFAIVSNDDGAPEVWGYSESVLSDSLPINMQWWLEQASLAIDQKSYTPVQLGAVPSKYKSSVEPLITTKWGQTAPYYNDLKFNIGGGTYQFLTGCVATAMAQIMNYYEYPARGKDSHSYSIDYGVGVVDFAQTFSNSSYDWSNMLDSYRGTSTERQKAAVALLMKDCGYSVDMSYNGNGSSASTENVAAALKNYFKYNKYTRYYCREHCYAGQWNDMIYNELSNGRPIFYGGGDNDEGGHAFIVDGYNESGLVHINWGWSGLDDGYYEIAKCNPKTQGGSYSNMQEMVIGIQPADEVLYGKEVTLTSAGTLSSKLTSEEQKNLQSLKIKGNVNSSDFKILRNMIGLGNTDDSYVEGRLVSLDLSEATIVAGGSTYYDSYTTKANTFPDCFGLVMDEGYISAVGSLAEMLFPTNMAGVGKQAFAANVSITTYNFPSTVSTLGQQSFFWISDKIRVIVCNAKTPPSCGTYAFTQYSNDNMFEETRIYVPDNSVYAYKNSGTWSYFKQIYGLSTYEDREKITTDVEEEAESDDNGEWFIFSPNTLVSATSEPLVLYTMDGIVFDEGYDIDTTAIQAGIYILRSAGNSQLLYLGAK